MSAGRILLVDKPVGPTSHDVVSRARRALGERRIGHTGTLDPFASGLVVLCVGPATRLAEYLSGTAKSYEATLRLGVSTTTLDPEGEVVEERSVPEALDPETLAAALDELRGPIAQVPPAFSAKKRGGERAYEKARRGEVVELDPVDVTVHELEVTAEALPDLDFRCRVSSGTYVRAIGRDLGERLGPGGHLTALRRTRVGHLDVASAVSLEDLVAWDGAPDFGHPAFLTPFEALDGLPANEVGEEARAQLAFGRQLPWEGGDAGVAIVHDGGDLLAVGRAESGRFLPRKVFVVSGGAS